MTDIINRLKDACAGHSAANIPWPHRLLHDAMAEIERLRSEVDRVSRSNEQRGNDLVTVIGQRDSAESRLANITKVPEATAIPPSEGAKTP